jgi:predicted DNA-binding protein with PD1-like motif
MRAAVIVFFAAFLVTQSSASQQTPEGMISPARPVAKGMAPGMQSKLVRQGDGERVYAVIFSKGDEVIGGLTDFAIANHIVDAHFTAIGASEGALLAWFDLAKKSYRPIPVTEQVEVVAFTGDIAVFNGVPVVHAHSVLSRPDGSTRAGHTFELHVNPTLEVFLTADDTPLGKRPDASGLKLIDPAR